MRWLVGIMIAATISPGCRRSPEARATEAASNASRLAASQEQAQLWQAAAKTGSPGLENVPTVLEPVAKRRGQSPPGRSTAVPPQPITIPAGVQSSVRIVDFPAEPAKSYDGPAIVVDAAGDRVRLDLGSKRILTVLARAGGAPVRVVAGETVRVAYRSEIDPLAQHVIIGFRNAAGAGIVNVVQAGVNPVEMIVPLFNITARQLGTEPTSPIRVSGPNFAPRDMSPGEIAAVGDVTVFIVGSAGVGKGTDVGLIDGTPYALNVMVWKVP